MKIHNLIGLSGICYKSIAIFEEKVIVNAEIIKKTAICPKCNKVSRSMHSYYIRKIRDLPACGKITYIYLKTRRFFCRNQHCKRIIFSEYSADFLPYTRLSKRAVGMLSKVLLEVSARKGSVISHLMALPVSTSSCLRLVHSLDLPPVGQITHLGVDDWALKKGCTYATALVNMDTGKIIDLLHGRDGIGLSYWLKNQKNILTVNRDRATSYSSVIEQRNPQIKQIADRFHLVRNLSDHVNAIIHNNSRLIHNTITQESLTFKTSNKYHRNNNKFQRVKSKLASGYSQTQVAKEVGLSRYTIWKYAQMDTYPIDIRRTNIFDEYMTIIEQELAKGTCLNQIYNLITVAGYKGARSNFYMNFGDKNSSDSNPFCRTMSLSIISKYMFSKNIMRVHNKVERLQMQILCKRISWFFPLNDLCSSFSTILRGGTKAQLDNWIDQAKILNINRLNRFVYGILKDYQAVLNAVIYSSSSGVVEGNINRLKNIKRQMYGRAGIELLKRKVILSASG